MKTVTESADTKDNSIPLPINPQPIRPIGAWVVAALVAIAMLTLWIVVSVVFYAYS
jgi:hypothetical protein